MPMKDSGIFDHSWYLLIYEQSAPQSDHCIVFPCQSESHSLMLLKLIDATLAVGDFNSKLIKIVTVAEEHADCIYKRFKLCITSVFQ